MDRLGIIAQTIARVNDEYPEQILRPLGESLIKAEKFDEMLQLHHRLTTRVFLERANANRNSEQTFAPIFSFVAASNGDGNHTSQIWIFPVPDVTKLYRIRRKLGEVLRNYAEVFWALIAALLGYRIANLPGAILGAMAGPIGTKATERFANVIQTLVAKKEKETLENRITLLAKGQHFYTTGYELVAAFMTARVAYSDTGRPGLLSVGRTFDDRTNLGQSLIVPRTIFKPAALLDPEYRFANSDVQRASAYEFYRNFDAQYRMLDCVFMGFFLGFTLYDEAIADKYVKGLQAMGVIPYSTLDDLRPAINEVIRHVNIQPSQLRDRTKTKLLI